MVVIIEFLFLYLLSSWVPKWSHNIYNSGPHIRYVLNMMNRVVFLSPSSLMTSCVILLTETFHSEERSERKRFWDIIVDQSLEELACDFSHTVCIHTIMSAGQPEALHGHLAFWCTDELKLKTRCQPPTLTQRLFFEWKNSVHPHTLIQTQHTQSHTKLPPLSSAPPPLPSSTFFPAVAHSLMDEMKYPVQRGWIPAQVKLSLTGFNALVTVLNEVFGDSESFLSVYSPWPWPLFLFYDARGLLGLLDAGN